MEKHELWPGVKVLVKDARYQGKIFRVVKRMRVNIRVRDGEGNTFVVHPNLLVKYTDGDPLPEAPKTSDAFVVGEPVRWSGKKSAVYVVIKSSKLSVSIAVLGGDEGKYRRVHPGQLTRVRLKKVESESASPKRVEPGYIAPVTRAPESAPSFIPADFSETFCKLMEDKHAGYVFTIQRGTKYDRIFYRIENGTGSKNIHCFIGRNTHNIYKAASRSAPAAGVRFSLRDRRDIERVVALSDVHGSYLYQRSR